MARTIAAVVQQTGVSSSEARLRQHRVTVDRPGAAGGSDGGPMGGELFLAAVGGCFMSNLLAAARARDVVLQDACVELEGTLADAPARYEMIHMRVSAGGGGDALPALVEIADRGCIMTNTLRGRLPVTITIA